MPAAIIGVLRAASVVVRTVATGLVRRGGGFLKSKAVSGFSSLMNSRRQRREEERLEALGLKPKRSAFAFSPDTWGGIIAVCAVLFLMFFVYFQRLISATSFVTPLPFSP